MKLKEVKNKKLKTKIVMDANNAHMNKYYYFMSIFMLKHLMFKNK
jgi:hypothetical protein